MRGWWIVAVLAVLAPRVFAQPAPDRCHGLGADKDGVCRTEPLPTVPTAVRIVADPPGAEVFLDTTRLGATPLVIEQGRLGGPRATLTLKHRGYDDKSVSVTLIPGKTVPVRVALLRIPVVRLVVADQDSLGGILVIDTEPRGTIKDGDTFELSPGKHHLVVTKPGHRFWTQDLDLAPGAAPLTIEVSLPIAIGTLEVRSATQRGVVGAEVSLQPGDEHRRIAAGTVPLTKRLPAGKYVLYLGPDETVTMVEVRADETTVVEASLPVLAPYGATDDTPIDKTAARLECEGGDGRACVVLGHAAIVRRDNIAALSAYRNGCNAHDRTACFSAGYLLRRLKSDDKDADALFALACEGGEVRACWARYARDIRDLPDPTQESGERYRYPAPKFGDLIAGGFGMGWAPVAGEPLTLQLRIAIGFPVSQQIQFGISGIVRGRMFWREDVTSGDRHTYGDFGLGYGLYAQWQPLSTIPIALRAEGVGVLAVPGPSNVGATGSLVYKLGSDAIELGVMLDSVPLDAQRVTAFGEPTTVTRSHWVATFVLGYSFHLPSS